MSTWHSPVPYLFGGLAAMLGLIAFALLILACSYWKISSSPDDDVEDEEKGDSSSEAKAPPISEVKILVIMAGEVGPTFLATPRKAAAETVQENGNESDEIGRNLDFPVRIDR